MPSFLYDEFVTSIMGSASASGFFPDLQDNSYRIFLIDHGVDVPNQATDQTVNDRAVGAQVPALASAPTLGSQSVVIDANQGKFDAADTVFAGLSGVECESIDLFNYINDTPTNDLLIANFNDYTGLPITPSGGNLVVIWPATGIIRI